MKNKVVVIVSGGNVQEIFAEVENTQIEMIDYDNAKEEGQDSLLAAEVRAKELVNTMYRLY
jgi:hypothetical protein